VTAKLTDFGFSTFCLSNWEEGPLLREGVYLRDRIYLTKSSLWSHPYRHEDGYSFKEAILEEVYAFGMSCFWIIFSQSTAFPSEAEIKSTKMEGQMLELCSELAQTPEMGLSRNQIAFLTRLFQATLSHVAVNAVKQKIMWSSSAKIMSVLLSVLLFWLPYIWPQPGSIYMTYL
jgi:hypothetical protein